MTYIIPYLFSAVAAVIALTVHEYCHGYTAYKLGDPTAKNLGRLSLNPLHHIDLFGAICMVLFHFGWAKPVPINARNFKKPKRDFALTAIAGPLSNILLAFLFTPLFMLLINAYISLAGNAENVILTRVVYNTSSFIQYFVVINLGLGLFNLVPFPPFDGSRIVNVLLPERLYFRIMRYEKYIYWGVVAWLLLGSYVYLGLMRISFIAGSPILSQIARIFSLSSLIQDAITFFFEIFIKFWSLIIH